MTSFLRLSPYQRFGMVCSEDMAWKGMLLLIDVGCASGLKAGEKCMQIDRNDTETIANMNQEIKKHNNS